MGEYTPKHIVNAHKTTLTPGEYIFMAMWIVIGGWILAWNILSYTSLTMLPSVFSVHILFALTCISIIVWIYLFTKGYSLYSTIAKLICLVLVSIIYVRVGIFYSPFQTKLQAFGEFAPFSFALGWLLFSFILNFFDAVLSKETSRRMQARGAMLVCITLLVPCGFMLWLTSDIFFCFSLMLVYIGIGSAQYMTGNTHLLGSMTSMTHNQSSQYANQFTYQNVSTKDSLESQQSNEHQNHTHITTQNLEVGKLAYGCAVLVGIGIIIRIAHAFS